MITQLIKKFEFTNIDRDGIFLSDINKIRVNTENTLSMRLQLKSDNEIYSLDDNIYAKTIVTIPNAVKQWQAIEIEGVKPNNTEWYLRLDDSVNEYYYDGANWVIAAMNDWNTEEVFNDNISSYTFMNNTKSIRIVIKLKTNNLKVTPYIIAIKLLGKYDIDFYKDFIYSTVIKTMKEKIKLLTDIRFKISPTTISIDLLNEYKIDNDGYNIIDVESVYDITFDSMRQNNLLDYYTKGVQKRDGEYEPGIITLKSLIPDNNYVHIRLIVIPEIVINTNQDYYELKKLPGIVLERIIFKKQMSSNIIVEQESVKDRINGIAVILQPPTQNNIRFEYSIFSLLQTELHNLMESIRSFLNENVFFISYGLDEKYRVCIIDDVNIIQNPNLDDINTGTGIFEIKSVPFYLRAAENVSLVKKLNLNVTTK